MPYILAMSFYEEFYVASNPPLLPRGVGLVIAGATKALGEVSLTRAVQQKPYSLYGTGSPGDTL